MKFSGNDFLIDCLSSKTGQISRCLGHRVLRGQVQDRTKLVRTVPTGSNRTKLVRTVSTGSNRTNRSEPKCVFGIASSRNKMKLKNEMISKSGPIGYHRYLFAVILILMSSVSDTIFARLFIRILHSSMINNQLLYSLSGLSIIFYNTKNSK